MSKRELSAPASAGIHVEDGAHLSRGDVLVKGALAVMAVYGLSAVGPYVSRSIATEAKSDVDVLNALLSLEYLQASLYNRGNSEVNDKGEKMVLEKPQKEMMELLLTQESEHVAAVKEMIEKLGGKPIDKGSYSFAFRVFPSLLTLASVLETVAAGGYNGAIPALESDEARDLGFSIAQVEGRHAAMVLISKEQEPAPEAFDVGLTEDSAINLVEQFTGVFPGE